LFVVIYRKKYKVLTCSDTWALEELAASLKWPPSLVRRRLDWWANCGVLQQAGEGAWKLGDRLPLRPNQGPVVAEEEEEAADTPSSAEGEKQLEVGLESALIIHGRENAPHQVFWPYIVGLLKNLDSLSAERILSLLKMFGSQRRDELSLELVHSFLRRKVHDQLLLHTAGVYKLVKK